MRISRIALLVACGLGSAGGAMAQHPLVSGRNGMVVSTQYLASQVGIDILKKGGNAIDAAIAVGYALAVVHPAAGNIGGGGFMTIRFADGRSQFVDFRERAPQAARPAMFQDANGDLIPGLSETGYLAAGVPGTVAGFELARDRWGTLPRETLIDPAIDLADRGFILKEGDSRNIAEVADALAQDPEAARIFLIDGKEAPPPGARLRQPDLAQSLRMISLSGEDAFYRGAIADAIVAASDAHHGILTRADFDRYAARERKPVTCTYRKYKIVAAAPPSSGGATLCELLNIVEGYDMARLGFHSAGSVHVLAEAMRHAFHDRGTMGDPDFVQNPLARMTDKSYAKEIRSQIEENKATASLSLGPTETAFEGPHTTDYAVIDRYGTAVSVVYTLNDWFGAKVVAPGTGIVLNDEMDDFAAKPGMPNADGLVTGPKNEILPGKAPLSSMTPTIVARPDGRTALVIGSFGSGTIISSIAQVIVNLVDYRMDLQEAVDQPRIHQQWLPDQINFDHGALSDEVGHRLEDMGYLLTEGTQAGASEAILIGGEKLSNRPDGRFYGANDRRAPVGAATGW